MDWFNFMWLVAFVFIFIGLNWLYSMIIKYIDDKPPGKCPDLASYSKGLKFVAIELFWRIAVKVKS